MIFILVYKHNKLQTISIYHTFVNWSKLELPHFDKQKQIMAHYQFNLIRTLRHSQTPHFQIAPATYMNLPLAVNPGARESA